MNVSTNTAVTVVIPTFNRKNWLKIAIESVLTESRVPITLHVFDNASSDGTMDYMQSLALNNKKIIYTRNAENIGMVRNFTLALDHVRTRYFVPLADDDFLLPDFLYNAFQLMEADRSLGAAVFVTEARNEEGSVLCTAPSRPASIQPGRMEASDNLRSWMRHGHYGWSSVLWRSDTLQFVKYPYYYTGLPSDVDFQAQVFCKYPAIFVNKPGAVWRVHKDQGANNINVSTVMSWVKLFRRLDRRVMELGVLPLEEYSRLRAVMANRYRGVWRRPSEQLPTDSRLARMAAAAGFWLGDWELAFSLTDRLKERECSSHAPAAFLQFPMVQSKDHDVQCSTERLWPRLSPTEAMLVAFSQYQRELIRQAREIEAVRACGAQTKAERDDLSRGLDALLAECNAVETRLSLASSEIAELREQLHRVHASRSWKLTKPLRLLRTLVTN